MFRASQVAIFVSWSATPLPTLHRGRPVYAYSVDRLRLGRSSGLLPDFVGRTRLAGLLCGKPGEQEVQAAVEFGRAVV